MCFWDVLYDKRYFAGKDAVDCHDVRSTSEFRLCKKLSSWSNVVSKIGQELYHGPRTVSAAGDISFYVDKARDGYPRE